MINKKFASAVGLGATAIGAASSTMTSATLFDLMKNDKEAQNAYLQETKTIKYRAAAKNIIKKMLSVLDNGDNNKSDLIEKLKNKINKKKNINDASEKTDVTAMVIADVFDRPNGLLEEKWEKIDENKNFKKKQEHNNSNEKISLEEYENRFSIIDSCLESISHDKKITNEEFNKLIENDKNFKNLLETKGITEDDLVLNDNSIKNDAIPLKNKEIMIKFMEEYLKSQEKDLINKLYNMNNDIGDIFKIIFDRAEKNSLSEKQVIKFLIENTMVKVGSDFKCFVETNNFKELFEIEKNEKDLLSKYSLVKSCYESISSDKKLTVEQFEKLKSEYGQNLIDFLEENTIKENELALTKKESRIQESVLKNNKILECVRIKTYVIAYLFDDESNNLKNVKFNIENDKKIIMTNYLKEKEGDAIKGLCETTRIGEYKKRCFLIEYCYDSISKGKTITVEQFEKLNEEFSIDRVARLINKGVEGRQLVLDIEEGNVSNSEILTHGDLKNKEKDAIKNFFENTCRGRVIVLNELNYSKGYSNVEEITGAFLKFLASMQLPGSILVTAAGGAPVTVSGFALSYVVNFATDMLTKFAFNKRTKNYDGVQPQLGDPVLPKEDIFKSVIENILSCSVSV